MAAVLALCSALLFGTGDFAGGLAARRTAVFRVMASSHLLGLALVVALTPLLADEFRAVDFGWGVFAGGFGLVGLALLYRGLSQGPMAVVAPITAVTSAAVPVAWGVAFGEDLSRLHTIGILFGLIAIACVSRDGSGGSASPGLILESLLAGVNFAAFFIIMDATDPATEPWPLVGARVATVTTMVVIAVVGRRRFFPARTEAPLIVVAGACDTLANLAFLMAVHRGLLSLVSVLSSLYPAVTVLLARWVLRERVRPVQIVGLAGALAATMCIAVG
jgi:drug/metabolite transporter (DMT)-like permease